MRGATAERYDYELSEVEAAVGPRSFERGRAYARRGRVVIDVARLDGAHAEVGALVRIDGDDPGRLEPVLFLGADGHGIVCADTSAGPDLSHWRLLLVRLARPVAPALQRMLLDREPLPVPASDLDRFAAE